MAVKVVNTNPDQPQFMVYDQSIPVPVYIGMRGVRDLIETAGDNSVRPIKILRNLFNIGLRDAKDCTDMMRAILALQKL